MIVTFCVSVGKRPKELNFCWFSSQGVAVLGIALIAMGEEIGSEMALRTFGHLVSNTLYFWVFSFLFLSFLNALLFLHLTHLSCLILWSASHFSSLCAPSKRDFSFLAGYLAWTLLSYSQTSAFLSLFHSFDPHDWIQFLILLFCVLRS